MACYKIPDPDDVIPCPYDKQHLVRAKRMPYHLQKCRKHYPDLQLRRCPFNAKHMVHSNEYGYHLQHCPDKVLVDRVMLYEQEEAERKREEGGGDTTVPDYTYMSTDGEDWDSEANGQVFKFGQHEPDPGAPKSMSCLIPGLRRVRQPVAVGSNINGIGRGAAKPAKMDSQARAVNVDQSFMLTGQGRGCGRGSPL